MNAIFSIGLFSGPAAFLRLRRFDLNVRRLLSNPIQSRDCHRRSPPTGGVSVGPSRGGCDSEALAGTLEKQEIIELFNASSTLEQRVLIILLAVTVAPLTEEFFFRFFLYGVLKRYFGRGVGFVASAMLFAAVHAHLPSFAPLFVLGICFTIAYEWSGSLLVSMTMHALFNALALTALAFPEVISQ